MNAQKLNWKDLGITTKFILAFSLLFLLILIVTGTGFISFFHIHRAEQKIHDSIELGQLILEMDRGLEKAKRLHGNFIIHYPSAGLQAAHEKYAQPAIREIAEVIRISEPLQKLMNTATPSRKKTFSQAELNLYLSSAQRFAETSIEAIELITLKIAPERGLEPRLNQLYLKLDRELGEYPDIRSMHKEAFLYFKDYLLSRQRYLMQSSINALAEIQTALTQAAPKRINKEVIDLFSEHRRLSEQLIDVDNKLAGKMRDFTLQEETVRPLSQKLTEFVQYQIQTSQQQIRYLRMITGMIMLSGALLTTIGLFIIARLTHTSITQNILRLTQAAQEFRKGNLDVQVQIDSRDEIGQLSKIFNAMVLRLRSLVNNLEHEVKQRTKDLAASEKRFRHLVNDLPKLAVYGFDEQRQILYWNKASELLYGYSEEEATGQLVEELLLPPLQRDGVKRQLNNWYQHGVICPSGEREHLRKDGTLVPVFSSPVMQTNSDASQTIYSVDIDLVELKLAEEATKSSQLFFRQMFEHSTSGIIVCEPSKNGKDFIIHQINQAGLAMNNLDQKDLAHLTINTLYPFAKKIGLLAFLHKVRETGLPQVHPVCHYQDKNFDSWRESRAYRLPSGQIVLVFDDLTLQKQAENEKIAMEQRLHRAQKMEAIGLMAGGVAHDLNNILSAIVGYPDLMLLHLPDESNLRQPILAMKEAGERSAAVVADLLTVARGVAKVQETHNLNTLVEEYLESPEYFKLKASHPDVQFRFSYEDYLPPILCSPVHVKKCIMNLVINAAEAIQQSGTVYLSTHRITPEKLKAFRYGLDPRDYTVLRVTDTGSGISEQDIENIFEPFYTKKIMGNKSGSGLGLSVVWNTMKDHHGAVIASNTKNMGACFELYFPGNKQEAPVAIVDQAKDEPTRGQGEIILVVDDEPQPRDIAVQMLIHLGYKVHGVNSGEEAISWLAENQADLVVLDMIMEPGLNGRETFERIHAHNPDQKAVIFSGFSESSDVKQTLRLGARGFLKKPFSIAQLSEMVYQGLHP